MNELHLPPAMPVNDGVAAVDRAMLAVSAIGTSSSPITLSELSRRTGLYKSTLLRLLASLQKAALVVQRPDLTYVLGPFAFRLGRAYDVGLPQTQRVGETPLSAFPSVAHGEPMLSLENTYSEEEVREFERVLVSAASATTA